MGNPSKTNEQGSAFEEEASSEEDTERNKNSRDSKDTSTALDSKMVEDSLDEKVAAIGEGHPEYTPQPLAFLPSICSSHFLFLLHFFIFIHLTLSISPGFTYRGKEIHPLRLVFS